MAITIKDVAKAAKVAPSTVSRVIADHPRISEDTKKRVRKAMKELGYHPNVNARSLANRSTQALGIVMKSSADKALQNPFFPEVLRGISSVAHQLDYSLYISTGETDEEVYEGVQRMVHGNRVDGIILLYSRVDDPVANYLLEKDFPFVLIGKPHGNMDKVTHVDNDNVSASRDITNLLIDEGHERIAFIGGDTDLVVTLDRMQGYELALQESELPIKEDYYIHAEFLKSGGREAVHQLFQLNEPPTGLVIADDLMSIGVITMLEEFGIRVPEDVSIVSFNNVYLSEITRPPLTTIDIQIYELGNQAAKCVIDKVCNKEEPAKRIIVPYHVMDRSSTKDIKGASKK
ncbi:LacI family DNA-binding transcriptional regulator [Pontibacillus yanchengensis]|uniref:LacI family DNA-binding transcriptional regulator n=2 Tax=Pontibacillus yanchengensis TaxID=462910 RepID=A0ACC7VFH6_9BACI|nr:LacI family DNA-binding transcriptional regulator [Pontibacillus yanchengensis]MYL32275.1 LacI family DNA-binding transcriptional regulator [Pontibacillus yanchengensis]MYL52855.1 LacI family DNA-binding transcriptional regulator [Pontibacillus yanchengensis]